MNLLILFTCMEHRIPPRGRKPRPVFLDAHVELEIREVTAEQAPVVVRVAAEGALPEVHYRWFGGRLWACLNLENGRPRGMSAGGKDWSFLPVPGELDLRGADVMAASREHGINVTRGPKSKMVDAFCRWAMDTLIVDGVTHRPAAEPCYFLRTTGLASSGETVVMLYDHRPGEILGNRHFGLMERDLAVRVAEDMARGRGQAKSLPMQVTGPEVEVLIPEALRVRNRSVRD